MIEEVQQPTPTNDLLFLAGRFWGRDEVARTGFVGLLMKAVNYLYICGSGLLLLWGLVSRQPATLLILFGGFVTLMWAAYAFIARNRLRDTDGEILKTLGITAERKPRPFSRLSWSGIKIMSGWEAPPATMTLSRDNIPFLLIEQSFGGSVPTIRLLADNPFSQKTEPSYLASPNLVPPVDVGGSAANHISSPVSDKL